MKRSNKRNIEISFSTNFCIVKNKSYRRGSNRQCRHGTQFCRNEALPVFNIRADMTKRWHFYFIWGLTARESREESGHWHQLVDEINYSVFGPFCYARARFTRKCYGNREIQPTRQAPSHDPCSWTLVPGAYRRLSLVNKSERNKTWKFSFFQLGNRVWSSRESHNEQIEHERTWTYIKNLKRPIRIRYFLFRFWNFENEIFSFEFG